jgi:PAS domain S-box-containing protein
MTGDLIDVDSRRARPRARGSAWLSALVLVASVAPLAGQQTMPAEGIGSGRSRPTASQLRARSWDDRNGLPQNSVQAVAQSPDGYIWMGTQEGLARFDGARFVTFDRRTDPALARPYIWALHADADNTLWIGTEEAGLIRKSGDRYEAFDTARGLPHPWVTTIERAAGGTLWVGTMGGVARMVGDRFEAIVEGLPAPEVSALLDDGARGVWVGTFKGLVRIDAQGHVHTDVSAGLPGGPIWDIARDIDGSVIVAKPQGVFRLRGDRFEPIAGLTGIPIGQLEIAADGTMYGSAGGMLLKRDPDGTVTDRVISSGGGPTVSDMTIDREGSVWIGTFGRGATRFRSTPFMPIGSAEGLSTDMVHAVLEDRSGGIWIGTGGFGANHLEGAEIDTLTASGGELAGNFVIAIREARDGAIYIGSNNGFSRIVNGQATVFGPDDGVPAPFQVRDVLEARDGTIWLALPSGLYRFGPGEPRMYDRDDGMPDEFVISLLEDPDGSIWIGLRRGLARLRDGRIESWDTADGLPDGTVGMMHRDRDGGLWLVGPGIGLVRMDANQRIRAYRQSDGLCEDLTSGIVEDESGALWISSNRGIFRVTREELAAFDADSTARLACKLYSRESGMRSREANSAVNPAALRARDGRLWFPTTEGIVVIDPARLSLELPPPPVLVEEVIADGRLVPGDSPSIPAGARNIEIRFTALTFVSPELVRFRYMLDGYDRDWIDAGERRSAFYTRLPPGSYTFRVMAANAEGTWNEAGDALELRMRALFWQTWWFRALVALAFLALLALAYRARVRQLTGRQRELEDLVFERSVAEARWRELFENATDAVFTTDLAGRVTAFNRTAEAMTGLNRADVLEHDVRDLLPAELRAAFVWPPESGARALPIELRAKDGRALRAELSTRVLTENGQPIAVLAVCRDVREREALEGQLRQAQKMEAVGQLAGGVAHDFNNLLTVIQGNGELLMAEFDGDDPRRQDLVQIVEAGHRASALTRQLLAFSRRQIDQPRVFELGGLVTGLEPMLRRLLGEKVAIAAIVPDRAAHVRADPAQMEQVIINLAVNARDAMPEGGTLTIETTVVDVDENAQWAGGPPAGRYALLSVRDTGMGMDADTIARIFEPFFTTKEQGRGTGLGLSTVYGIVQNAGGHVRVHSEPGQGATFRVYLPHVTAAVDAVADARDVKLPGGSETILLVEDEDAVRALTARVLRRLGYTVVEARHGRDAIARAEAHPDPIHLLISDVVLPEMSGGRVAEALRARIPDLPVVFMSGYTDDEIVRADLEKPDTSFLQKPFTAAELAKCVRDVLSRGNG